MYTACYDVHLSGHSQNIVPSPPPHPPPPPPFNPSPPPPPPLHPIHSTHSPPPSLPSILLGDGGCQPIIIPSAPPHPSTSPSASPHNNHPPLLPLTHPLEGDDRCCSRLAYMSTADTFWGWRGGGEMGVERRGWAVVGRGGTQYS